MCAADTEQNQNPEETSAQYTHRGNPWGRNSCGSTTPRPGPGSRPPADLQGGFITEQLSDQRGCQPFPRANSSLAFKLRPGQSIWAQGAASSVLWLVLWLLFRAVQISFQGDLLLLKMTFTSPLLTTPLRCLFSDHTIWWYVFIILSLTPGM